MKLFYFVYRIGCKVKAFFRNKYVNSCCTSVLSSPPRILGDITINARASQSFLLKLYGFTMQYNSETAILKCLDKEVKVAGNNGNLSIRLLMDTVNTEVFADDGSVFLGMTYIQDYNLNTLSVTAENSTGEIDVDVKEIKRYWE